MQATNTSLFHIAFLSLALCFSSTAFAKIYKWTDANGKTHYTATPPPTNEKANTEEFKVQKIKKSSLTNINESAMKTNKNGSLDSNYNSIDLTVSAQSQCKKVSKKMPKMYSYIKNKIEESKLAGKMTDSQYKKALQEMRKSQKEQNNFSKCVRDYNKGNHTEIDQVANNSTEEAFVYLLLKSQKDQKELSKTLQFK